MREHLAHRLVMKRLAHRLVSIYPGHQRGRGGRSKQANTKEQGMAGTKNRGARRGEKRNDDHKTTRTEGRNKDGGQASKQGMKQLGHEAITHKNKKLLILFVRPPHRWLSSVRRPQTSPPRPRAWDARMRERVSKQAAGVPYLIGYRFPARSWFLASFAHRCRCRRPSCRLIEKLGRDGSIGVSLVSPSFVLDLWRFDLYI